MTPQTQATQIVQKHYEIIESHLSTYPITDDHKMEMAKKHAAEEVRGIIEELEYFNYKLTPVLAERIRFYESVLTEIENTI